MNFVCADQRHKVSKGAVWKIKYSYVCGKLCMQIITNIGVNFLAVTTVTN